MDTLSDRELNARLVELSKIASDLFERASATGTVPTEREEVLRIVAEQSERKPDRIACVEGSHHGHPCEIERHHRLGEPQRRLLTVLLTYGAHTIHLRGSLEHARERERPENTHAPTIFVIAWLHIVVVACHLGG